MIRRVLNRLRRLAGDGSTAEQLRALQRTVEANYHRTGVVQQQIDILRRENQMLLGQMTLPEARLWRNGPPVVGPSAPGVKVFDHSTACRQEAFEAPYYAYWVKQLGYASTYHRKMWEFVFILQALHERGLIREGARGVGFGVGEEPLANYFASRGCLAVGTDMAPEAAANAGWTETAQYAAGKAALRVPWLGSQEVFEKNVDFRVVDMNAIPADLSGFDFCWSACALEHLGSIDLGLDFIENSLKTLRPGGFAIHTSELNISSNDETVEQGGTVLFRRRDFEALAQRLTAAGHVVAPLDFDTGDGPLDRYIDVPPFRAEPHLKLALDGYAVTSFGIIVQRAP